MPPRRDAWRTRAAAATLAAIVWLASGGTPGFGQVSPGPLSRPHRSLEGTLKCRSCHGSGKDAMDGKCLECHAEIAWMRERGRGYHGREGTGACASCHPDHGGLDFELVQWPEGEARKFDHRRTGWPLEGSHASLECARCHQEKHRVSPAARLAPAGDLTERWIGPEPGCASCHRDPHAGALGSGCAACHGQTKWRPVASFDHAKTRFALEGEHARVECAKCHMAARLKLPLDEAGRPAPLYKPIPHAECGACHQDPHAGRLGAACSRCHQEGGWVRVEKRGFDHALTRYPLRGRHAAVDCARCHDPVKGWGKRPAFGTCGSCHADPHAGTATLAGARADCAACHDVAGWTPSTFTAERHAKTKYPLGGKHRTVACASCHVKEAPGSAAAARLGPARVVIRAPFERCTSCHSDAHGRQVVSRPHKGACEACHNVAGWKPSTWSIAQHASLELPLEGRHAKIPCAACHGPSRTGLASLPGPEAIGRAGVALVLGDASCSSCHRDPHDGRFAAGGARPVKAGCAGCHGVESFRPSKIDVSMHAKFGYPLEGAHRAVACDRCHRESAPRSARSSLLLARDGAPKIPFIVSDQRCAGCHEDAHRGQFAGRRDRGACGSCHTMEGFRPASRFDHDRDSGFPLAGAHARVACARCHTGSRRDSSGRAFIVYRPVPRDCRSCHGVRAGMPATPAAAPVPREEQP